MATDRHDSNGSAVDAGASMTDSVECPARPIPRPEIHDGIRYTFLFEKEHYSDGVARAREQLTSMGFELLVMKNTWDNEE